MMRALAVLTAVVAVAPPLFGASRRAPAQRPVVVLLPLLTLDAPNAELVAGADRALEKAAAEVSEVSVIAGKELERRLHADLRSTLATCADDANCIIGLGRRVQAKEVLLGRARREGDGLRIIFAALDAKSGALARKLVLEVASPAQLEPVLGGCFYALLGMNEPGFVEVSGAAADAAVEIDGQRVGVGSGRYSAAPGRRSVAVGGDVTNVMVRPKQTVPLGGALPVRAPPPAPADQPLAESLALEPLVIAPPAEPSVAADAPFSAPTWFRYAGLGLAGVGVASLGTGAIFAVRAKSATRSITPRSSLPATLRAESASRRNATRANVLLITGGIAAAVGAVAFGLPWFFPETQASVAVDPADTAVSLTVGW